MINIVKKATENLYHQKLKGNLEDEFNRVMQEIGNKPLRNQADIISEKKIEEQLTGHYSTEVLTNLIQFSAVGLGEINDKIEEELHNPAKIFEAYEPLFDEVKKLEKEALELNDELTGKRIIMQELESELPDLQEKSANNIPVEKKNGRKKIKFGTEAGFAMSKLILMGVDYFTYYHLFLRGQGPLYAHLTAAIFTIFTTLFPLIMVASLKVWIEKLGDKITIRTFKTIFYSSLIVSVGIFWFLTDLRFMNIHTHAMQSARQSNQSLLVHNPEAMQTDPRFNHLDYLASNGGFLRLENNAGLQNFYHLINNSPTYGRFHGFAMQFAQAFIPIASFVLTLIMGYLLFSGEEKWFKKLIYTDSLLKRKRKALQSEIYLERKSMNETVTTLDLKLDKIHKEFVKLKTYFEIDSELLTVERENFSYNIKTFETKCREAIRRKVLKSIERSYETNLDKLHGYLVSDLEYFKVRMAQNHEETDVHQYILNLNVREIIQNYNESSRISKQFDTPEKYEYLVESLKRQIYA